MSENIFKDEFGINAECIAATKSGVEVLRGNLRPQNARRGQILGLVNRFARQPEKLYEIFRPYADNSGTQSMVYRIGERAGPLVVKVSTPDTIFGKPTAERPLGPEDLITQFMVMNTVKTVLEETTGGVITAPQHHYAMRVRPSYSLSIMDFMDKWLAMDIWLKKLHKEGKIIDRHKEDALLTVNDRIQDAVDGTPFEEVFTDLYETPGFDDQGKITGILRSDNVLVPIDAGFNDIDTMNLCLIDQPPPFESQLAAAKLAVAHFAYRPDYYTGEAIAA